jgi:hypothetical protein
MKEKTTLKGPNHKETERMCPKGSEKNYKCMELNGEIFFPVFLVEKKIFAANRTLDWSSGLRNI